MEFLQIIIGQFLINFLGVNTRFYFFKIFNKDLKKKEFTKEKENDPGGIMQGIYNVFIGFAVLILLCLGIAYIFYKMGIL